MANKIYNFTDLIQRVTASCLLSPLVLTHEHPNQPARQIEYTVRKEEEEEEEEETKTQDSEEDCEETLKSDSVEGFKKNKGLTKLMESEALMAEMFDAVSDLKRAYVTLQEAHSPWDPMKMSLADAAVLKELKRMGRLKERFKRMSRSGGGLGSVSLREAVAPYEETVDELKREVKAKEAEVENLQEKLRSVTVSLGGKKGRFQSKRKLSFSQGHVAPVPELFEATMSQVKETSKSFTSLLLSLMRSARWDIAATVQSIESGPNTPNDDEGNTTSTVGSHHAKFALESYICSKIFSGFDHETFYMDGSLSSLLNPEQFRRDCFTQFRDMNSMDPSELLGILPSCPFGQFCCKKYLSMISPEMEESLFGDLEQNRLISSGNHPRTTFYGQFLKATKAVWLLHLLAFSLDPSPSLFLASKGAEFQSVYMESVVRVSGKSIPTSQIVGIPVSPGFKLRNGSIIKARVYLVPKK